MNEIDAVFERRRKWLAKNPGWRPCAATKKGRTVMVGAFCPGNEDVKVFWHCVPGLEAKLKPENKVYDG